VRFALLAFAQTAACNRLHHLEHRCRRWLLIAHDNALSDTVLLTHETLAMVLARDVLKFTSFVRTFAPKSPPDMIPDCLSTMIQPVRSGRDV
jgi:hypothetical protein